MSAAPAPDQRGRPRDPEVDRAILEATQRLLFEEGFARMSIAAVAAAAGVGKAAIYRRYAGKAELAIAAIGATPAEDRIPDTGAVRADLVAALGALRRKLDRNMALLGTLLAEEPRNPALLEGHRRHVIDARKAHLRGALERGVARGELRADADLDVVLEMLVGAIFARYLVGRRTPRDWPERVVDYALAGIRAPGA